MNKYFKGFLLGAAGGALGTLLMGAYMHSIEPLLPEAPPADDHEPSTISLTGKHFRKGEESTESTARVLYKTVMSREPSKKTRKTLAQGVHWGFGLTMAGLYGSMRAADAEGADLLGGVLFGTGVAAFQRTARSRARARAFPSGGSSAETSAVHDGAFRPRHGYVRHGARAEDGARQGNLRAARGVDVCAFESGAGGVDDGLIRRVRLAGVGSLRPPPFMFAATFLALNGNERHCPF